MLPACPILCEREVPVHARLLTDGTEERVVAKIPQVVAQRPRARQRRMGATRIQLLETLVMNASDIMQVILLISAGATVQGLSEIGPAGTQ